VAETPRTQAAPKRTQERTGRPETSTPAVSKEEEAAREPQEAKLVIHNPALGIEYPPTASKQFAVVQVDGFQYKVMEDTILLLDTKQDHAIN
jgi:hypothetical protein